VVDYETNGPCGVGIAYLDSSFSKENHHIITKEFDNIIKIDSITVICLVNLTIKLSPYETLKIRNIPIKNMEQIDLGTVALLGGSYLWDGYCTHKYLFGLIKKTKGCGGYIKGFIESHPGIDSIEIEFPKHSSLKKIRIQDKSLVVNYEDLLK
jgi:hypothetical protein